MLIPGEGGGEVKRENLVFRWPSFMDAINGFSPHSRLSSSLGPGLCSHLVPVIPDVSEII